EPPPEEPHEPEPTIAVRPTPPSGVVGLEARAPVAEPVPIAVDLGLGVGALWTAHRAHAAVTGMLVEQRGSWSMDIYGRLALAPNGARTTQATGDAMPSPSSSVTTSREVGLELGHRFELHSIAITASAGPSFVWLQQLDPRPGAMPATAKVVR